MKKQLNLKDYLPHIVGIIIFYVLAYTYLSPVLEGKIIKGGDILTSTAQQKAIKDHYNEYKEWPKWTDALFSGMPSTFVYAPSKGDLLAFIKNNVLHNIFGVYPAVPLIIMMLGFYFLLLVLNVNPWLCIVGAIGYGFTSFFFILLLAGHATQTFAFAYIPPIIAAVIIAFRKSRWLGAILLSVFVSFELSTSHPQMAYYGLLLVLIYGLIELYWKIKEKVWKKFVGTSLILVFFSIVAVGTNMNMLYPQYTYQKYSIRSPSELTSVTPVEEVGNPEKSKGSGLDYDYATSWSYDIGEAFTILIPNVRGGSGQDYWGEQPFTAGPMYIGSILVFLFLLSLFLLKGRIFWWLLISTLLSIFLCWGHNSFVYDLFFYYVPMFNKFRNPSWSLILAMITIPVGATLALQAIITKDYIKEKIKKQLIYSAAIVGGICFLFWLSPGLAGDFEKEYKSKDGQIIPEHIINAQQYAQQTGNAYNEQLIYAFEGVQDKLVESRKDLLKKDAFRSFLFILLAFIAILIFLRNEKFTNSYLIISIGLLILVDLWGINKRYLNKDHFSSRKKEIIQPAKVNNMILEMEKGNRNSRVLDLTTNLDQDSRTMFFHPSIGGYHGAKIRRYQDLIDHNLGNEFMSLRANLREYDSILAFMPVLNMLNTKYIIYNNDAPPLINPYAFGGGWFIKNIKWASNPNEEIESLNGINPRTTVVINEKYKDQIKNFIGDTLTNEGKITLSSYKMDNLVYDVSSRINGFVVFSELFYPDWHAYIDGNEVPVLQCNYILRGIEIPKGDHKIEFKYIATEFLTGGKIAYASSFTLIGFFIVLLILQVIKKRGND